MKIVAIVGSTRQNAAGPKIGQWVKEQAPKVTEGIVGVDNVELDVVELGDFDLPLFDGHVPPMALGKKYDDERATKWSKVIDEADAFLFITPEYNHSVPAPFKNAVDTLGAEWSGKAVGFVGYSYTGGVRVVEHWRCILANFQMADVRNTVDINLGTALDSDGNFVAGDDYADALRTVVSDVATLANQLAK